MQDLKEVITSIRKIGPDIRAEAILAELLDNGWAVADQVVILESAFKRKYSRDIASVGVKKLENGQELLALYINRDGIYDSLPEGIFHDQSSEPRITGTEMAIDSKRKKAEEKAIRTFFLPFENEIFLQRIFLEKEERNILYRFSESLFDEIFPEFWNLDKTLPKKLVTRFALILHLTHQIVGNLEMTARCLEVILDEDVTINHVYHNNEKTITGKSLMKPSPTLGNCALGENFVAGEYKPDSDPVLEFVIGPLAHSSVEDYLENGSYKRFLDCFYRFFVPLEMDVATMIRISEVQQDFVLHEQGSKTFLGFNSTI
ncbi:MAG: hypothetical protein NTX61_15790 [Bacteroidetes bacterium]|nr:hypothetical protein [Bacteroidota bacterium]